MSRVMERTWGEREIKKEREKRRSAGGRSKQRRGEEGKEKGMEGGAKRS